jgi:hypothetical protein
MEIGERDTLQVFSDPNPESGPHSEHICSLSSIAGQRRGALKT